MTVVRDRTRVAAAVTGHISSSGLPIYVVDIVLDRSGVDAMHRSIRGATEGVLQLRTEFRAAGQETTLIAASTTAVLAPGLYQTPYGLAKRRQVVTYARSGVAGAALLLPQLGPGTGTVSKPQPTWSFEQAAQALVSAVSAAPHHGFTVRVPALDADARSSHVAVNGSTLLAHLHSLVLDRDSMLAHRAAARSRLGWTPERLRLRFDHHHAPAALVRRFGKRYHLVIVDERSGCGPIPWGSHE
ncbi:MULTISPECIES: hypothetical protein [unclassified Micromonospora]|uniref:hypothetical protein n=1 Tax=unclassified Micromonospora TaxID=2617518 RepID=UPI003645B404